MWIILPLLLIRKLDVLCHLNKKDQLKMNVEKLIKELKELGIPESLYSILEGGTPSEKLCLVHEDEWRIYYSERGGRTGERAYPTEEEACEVFLRMLKRSAEK